MKNICIALMICSAFLLGCTNASEEDLIDQPPQLPDPVTYVDHVKPIIDANCLNCHSDPPQNGAPSSLVDYGDVTNGYINGNLLNRISGQPGDTGFMPEGGNRLPQLSIDIIEKWETDGFQNN
ncbi:MAG: hypothetical protein HKN54_07690 [Flavobacteriaceae bacterium]|nr:hypothetical protein [Flavobacteriaceae bacterium]